MLKINNRRLEDQIKEILQHTSFASAEEYLAAMIARDHYAVKRGQKLPQNVIKLEVPGESRGDHAAAAGCGCIA